MTSLLFNVALRHGLDGEKSKLLGEVTELERCIEMSCSNIEGNTAFLLGKRCYVLECPREQMCDTIALKTPGITSGMAYLQRPRSHLDYKGIRYLNDENTRHLT